MIDEFLNDAIAEVHDVLLQKWEDYAVTETTLPTVAGQDYVTLPGDFYKLLGLDFQRSATDRTEMFSFALSQRNMFQSERGEPRRYRLQDKTRLVLAPIPNAVYTLRLLYAPSAAKLVADGDVYDGINGYEKLVVTIALLAADIRENRPTGDRIKEIDRLWARVTTSANARDAAEPQYLIPPASYGDDLEFL